jgi:hypothetical protein
LMIVLRPSQCCLAFQILYTPAPFHRVRLYSNCCWSQCCLPYTLDIHASNGYQQLHHDVTNTTTLCIRCVPCSSAAPRALPTPVRCQQQAPQTPSHPHTACGPSTYGRIAAASSDADCRSASPPASCWICCSSAKLAALCLQMGS